MEKLLSSRSLKKEPEQSWEAPALGGLCCSLGAVGLQMYAPSEHRWELTTAFGVVATLCAALGLLFCWLRLSLRLGLCPSLYHSTVLRPVVKDRTIRFQVATGAYLASLAGVFACMTIAVVSTLSQADYKTNAAPLFLILLSPGLSCLCAYIVCKEGLQFFQVLGILLETIGLAMATMSIEGYWIWSALVLGSMGLTALTARSVLIKIIQEVKFDQTSETILELFTAGVLSTAAGVYEYYHGEMGPLPEGWKLVVRLMEAAAWILAICSMNMALYSGPTALVLGLICLSADVFLVIFRENWCSYLVSGLALTLIGGVSFLFLDHVLAHTAVGRILSRPKKTSQRDSATSSVYIPLIDR